MKAIRIKPEQGFTLIEVLIAAVVFMLGFSLLVVLLNNTLVRTSSEELILASDIGREFTLRAITLADTSACDSLVQRAELHFRVVKQVEIDGQLAKLSVTVYRQKTNKQIVNVYDEFLFSKNR
jgi:type II secretory pathway component PulJ